LLPHLSLSRCILSLSRDPSGSHPVATKHERPFSVSASVKKTSLIGTEKNHLWPREIQLATEAIQSRRQVWPRDVRQLHAGSQTGVELTVDAFVSPETNSLSAELSRKFALSICY
jgi:hypothetical protein